MRPALTLAPLLFAGIPAAGLSQDFRVYTTVSDVTGEKPVERSRSLTLFHAGQAWDHAVEQGEVVRFDPAAATFTLLDVRRDMKCAVNLAEIARQVTVGRQHTETYIAALAADPNPGSAALARSLAFQLAPRFNVTDARRAGLTGGTKTLTFAADPLTYEIEPVEPKNPGVSAFYLDYADWTARLNYALRPGALFPDVRAKVHETLRERGVVPQRVVLRMSAGAGAGDGPGTLRAEHVFQEKLDPTDREFLQEWKALIDRPTTREVTFREYLRVTNDGIAQR